MLRKCMTNGLEVLKEQKNIFYLTSIRILNHLPLRNYIENEKSQLSKCKQTTKLFCLF